MRPRRKILLLDSNEVRRSELRFVLDTWGFSVKHENRGERDLAIAHWPISWAAAKKLKEQSPLLIIGASESVPPYGGADAVLTASCPRWELLERIRALMVKKRGPRPKPKECGSQIQEERSNLPKKSKVSEQPRSPGAAQHVVEAVLL